MLLRSLFLCFFLLSLTEVTAQPVLFSTFLSEFKKCARIELASFGDSVISSTLDGDMYEKFLPSDASDCLCNPADIFWQQGGYMKCEDFVIVMLQRHCPDYQDGNSRWLMENLLTDYMLITYSLQGKVLDHKVIGHRGEAYFTRIRPTQRPLGFLAEQGSLDDCSLLLQYKKDLAYTVRSHEFIIDSEGSIEDKPIGAPQKEFKRPKGSDDHITFEQFLSCFEKWDKPYTNDSLFIQRRDAELPIPASFDFIPDTLDCDCTPKNIMWTPCSYIVSGTRYFFFVVKSCLTPNIGLYPYADYMILEFNQDGLFKRALYLLHVADNQDMEDIPGRLNQRLKKYERIWNMPSVSYGLKPEVTEGLDF